ncbi:c-type cytochrome [Roseovarius salis]|uniref:c-type cytochrome n=1 Tax=Roseovarius salis TaxID=3376063 RepID=UPI0037C71FCA
MKFAMFAMALGAVAAAASAEDMTFGELEYMNSCAQCHGSEGKGGGPMAGYLTESLPDLTQIQKNNGGVFPVTAVST